jgi:chemotaxis protein methyltransferase CheR
VNRSPFGSESEFPLTADDFARIRTLIRDYCGISLSDAKRGLVYSRLSRRLRATGKASFAAYLKDLARGTPEWEHFVNSLTTNLTYFYREPHHFPVLAEHLKRQAAARPGQTLNIWCAAASTGEEAWTLALTAAEALGPRSAFQILATDIDTQVLSAAQRASYKPDALAKIPPDQLKRWFRPIPGTDEQEPIAELRQRLTFRSLNLLDPVWTARGPFDAIFCRNVLIYFDRDVQLRVVERFASLLHPQGLLFVGHSENFSQGQTRFRLRGKTVYELA